MVSCLLIALKTNPNVADNAGWAPLHEACNHKHLDIVSLLLSNGADANASATDGTRSVSIITCPTDHNNIISHENLAGLFTMPLRGDVCLLSRL